MTGFTFRPMTDADIEVYRSWFVDRDLAARLDAPNDAWIAHVRSAATAWLVLVGDDLVAHLQTETEGAEKGALSLVVAPRRQGTGLGAEILNLFLKHHLLEQAVINAHIAMDHAASRKTLTASGFVDTGEIDADGFAIFAYRPCRLDRSPGCGAS